MQNHTLSTSTTFAVENLEIKISEEINAIILLLIMLPPAVI